MWSERPISSERHFFLVNEGVKCDHVILNNLLEIKYSLLEIISSLPDNKYVLLVIKFPVNNVLLEMSSLNEIDPYWIKSE